MDKQIFLSKTEFDFSGKTVLIRIDCDVDLVEEKGNLVVDEDFRLRQAMPTIEFLENAGVQKIILLGHLGRSEGKVAEELKLAPVAKWFICHSEPRCNIGVKNPDGINNITILNSQSNIPDGILRFAQDDTAYKINEKIILLENLRFDKREEENDEEFAKQLAGLGDVYINEAFGVSHREHASITGIPKFIPSFLGLNFEKEIEVLSELRETKERPLIFVLGGSKKDKLEYLEFLGEWCDRVLVGGKLPILICHPEAQPKDPDGVNGITNIISQSNIPDGILRFAQDDRIIISNLTNNRKDIDDESTKKFIEIIKTAKTIVWAGPMGIYEEEENRKGTFEIAKAIVESEAGFKVAGGGDTHRILSWLGIWNKFNFVSCGGGAMLAFLKDGNLPGIKAIKNISNLILTK